MRFAKIAPRVAYVTCGRKTLSNKEETYQESMWPRGHFDDLLRRGFIIEVDGKEKKIVSPDNAKISKKIVKKLTKQDLKNNPDLKKSGLRIGDEIEIEEEKKPLDEGSGKGEG